MKRGLTLILIVVLICSVLVSCTPADYSELKKTLDDFFANDKTAFSGSVLIAIDEKIILKKGYGMADYDNQIPNTPQTEFRIGSITKQFTAMAIMMLEERGLLSVNDPITKYIPDFKGGEKITIHHLMSMSSSIGDYIADDWENCDRYYTVDELVSKIKNKRIGYGAGKKFEYSNSSYILLGLIIEKVSGMEYGEFLKKNIFEPLDMNSTCYDYKEDQLSNKAVGYIRVSDITKDDNPECKIMNMSYLYAAGGLYSTVEDLYKWDQALYTEKLVQKETLKKMFTPYLENYGYGWFTSKKYKDCVCHSGMVKGFISYIYRFIDNKTTIIMLTNEEDESGIESIFYGLFEIVDKYGIVSKNKTDS